MAVYAELLVMRRNILHLRMGRHVGDRVTYRRRVDEDNCFGIVMAILAFFAFLVLHKWLLKTFE